APHQLVGLAAEVAHEAVARGRGRRRGRRAAHSVHFTSGCSRSTACATSYCSRDSARNVSFTDTNLPPLDSRTDTVSRSTGRPAASSSDGICSSRPLPAGPIAVISNSPGNWKPWSGLSEWMSMSDRIPPHPELVPQALEEAALGHRLERDQRALRHHLSVERHLHHADLLALRDRRDELLRHVHGR